MSVVVGEARLGIDSKSRRPRQGIGSDNGAGSLFGAVHAIGVGRQRVRVRQTFSSIARDSRNSTLRPPRPWPRTVTVVSPPEIKTQGGDAG